MKPAPFVLHRAASVDHAVELLTALETAGSEAKIIAGGQSLVPMMNFRLARPDHLIDLSAVEELHTIRPTPTELSIGAMMRQRDCLEDAAVLAWAPLLAEGIRHIGHGHIRNRGTIGGSVAHADPAAELPAVLLALDAELEVAGPSGRRRIEAGSFFQGWFATGLAANEVLVAVHLPVPGSDAEWSFHELARRHGDFAMVLAATVARRDTDGRISDARVVVGGVGPTPLRIGSAEQILVGSIGDEQHAAAAAAARDACSPTSDVHADATYRSEMVEVLVERCLNSATRLDASMLDVRSVAAPMVEAEPVAAPVLDVRSVASAMVEAEPVAAPVVDVRSVDQRRPSPPSSGERAGVTVNGDRRALEGVPDRRLLADWLRDDLGLTGTHLGCEQGACGACTVLVDGEPVRSCLVFACQVVGREVTTIEALGTPAELHPVQEAFRANHGLQCGFCTPGMILSTIDLLARIPHPSEAEIRAELSGNLCRCTGYVKIIEAVQAAAGEVGDRDGLAVRTGVRGGSHRGR